ncbi:MAG: hypothetical protein PF690_04020 [Deltaproteobacteria bacterium]|jgi:hypothetical protein|nr:hypothetical protein [Deltaproteobacteria bacterium]
MKNHSKIILLVIIIFSIYSSCSANPLSNFMSIFQKDFALELIYKNHHNLIQGSGVYLAKDPKCQKTLIGEVTKVSLVESKMSRVEIRIDKKYKDQIYETTPFVLMSNIFSQNANAYIIAISSFDASGKKLLKSGSSVKGITFFEYKFAATGEELKKVMDRIEKQNRELLNQLGDYIDTLNTEEFQKKIDGLADQITQFSKEQKETFKNDVLPALKNMFNSIIEQLEKQNKKEKSKNLEKQLKEIEEKVDV